MAQVERTEEQLTRIRDFVAALRSGEYEQTGNQLAREVGGKKAYCCEGVAVERYGAQLGFKVNWHPTPVSVSMDAELTIDGVADYAEDNFWEALGVSVGDNDASSGFAFVMPTGLDVRNTGGKAVSYMALNDEGLTFAQIADLIEWQHLS
jgi:hypothetical protein